MIALIVFSTSALASPSHADLAAASWQPFDASDHDIVGPIALHQATIEGIHCYQVAATTPVAGETLLAILIDPKQAMTWSSAKISEAEVLARTADTVDYYQHLSVPGWTMVSDRFWFSHGRIERTDAQLGWHYEKMQDGGNYKEAYEAHRAKHPKAVEPPVSVGSWTFRAGEAGTEVLYRVCTDVGGSLPGPVQRMATKSTLPNTVSDLIVEGIKREQR